MFYIISLIPLAYFFGDEQRTNFFFKFIILIHIYRESGKIISVLLKRILCSYTDFDFKQLGTVSRFSFEIILGLSFITLLYFLAGYIDKISGGSFFIYFIRMVVYSIFIFGIIFKFRNWLKENRKKRKFETLRQWQEIVIFVFYFSFITVALVKVSGSSIIHSIDDFHHIYIAKIMSTHGIYQNIVAPGHPIQYPSVYGVWNALACILVFASPVNAVHFQPIFLNFTLIFLFFYFISQFLKLKNFTVYFFLPLFLFMLPVFNHGGSFYAFAPRLVFPLLFLSFILTLYGTIFSSKNRILYVCLGGFLFSFLILLNPSCIPPAIITVILFFLFFVANRNFKNLFFNKSSRFILIFVFFGVIFFIVSDPYYINVLQTGQVIDIRDKIQQQSIQPLFSLNFALANFDFQKILNISFTDAFLHRLSIPVWLFGFVIFFAMFIKKVWQRFDTLLSKKINQFLLYFISTIILERLLTIFFSGGLSLENRSAYFLHYYLQMNRQNIDDVYIFALFFIFLILAMKTLMKIIQTRSIEFFGRDFKLIFLFFLIITPYFLVAIAIKKEGFPLKKFYVPQHKYLVFSNDDKLLVDWIRKNPKEGTIALHSEFLPIASEGMIRPFSAASLYILETNQLNYCFLEFDPKLEFPYLFYQNNVMNWNSNALLDQNIRYWIINKENLPATPAIEKAIRNGFLQEDKCFSNSCLYKVQFK